SNENYDWQAKICCVIYQKKISAMNKIVVPVDFSDTSKNAAQYAVQMANDIGDCSIILYNVYDEIAAGTDGTPLYNDEESRNTIALMALANVKADVVGK